MLNLSHQLRREEVTEIAYLYNLSEDFRESKGLAILEKLEKDGYYSMESPKGLATVFYRIKRKDLEKQTKELVKALTSKQKESSHKKRTETKCACDSATYHLMQGALPHIKNARKLAAQCSKKEAIEVEKLMKAAIMNFLKESEMVYLLEEGYITSPDEIISKWASEKFKLMQRPNKLGLYACMCAGFVYHIHSVSLLAVINLAYTLPLTCHVI